MAHVFEFVVTVTTDRESGKFAGRQEQIDALIEMLEGANEGSISGIGSDGESEYTISDWEVSEK